MFFITNAYEGAPSTCIDAGPRPVARRRICVFDQSAFAIRQGDHTAALDTTAIIAAAAATPYFG